MDNDTRAILDDAYQLNLEELQHAGVASADEWFADYEDKGDSDEAWCSTLMVDGLEHHFFVAEFEGRYYFQLLDSTMDEALKTHMALTSQEALQSAAAHAIQFARFRTT